MLPPKNIELFGKSTNSNLHVNQNEHSKYQSVNWDDDYLILEYKDEYDKSVEEVQLPICSKNQYYIFDRNDYSTNLKYSDSIYELIPCLSSVSSLCELATDKLLNILSMATSIIKQIVKQKDLNIETWDIRRFIIHELQDIKRGIIDILKFKMDDIKSQCSFIYSSSLDIFNIFRTDLHNNEEDYISDDLYTNIRLDSNGVKEVSDFIFQSDDGSVYSEINRSGLCSKIQLSDIIEDGELLNNISGNDQIHTLEIESKLRVIKDSIIKDISEDLGDINDKYLGSEGSSEDNNSIISECKSDISLRSEPTIKNTTIQSRPKRAGTVVDVKLESDKSKNKSIRLIEAYKNILNTESKENIGCNEENYSI
ncbi:uncharacterized protein CMU_026760 [Cryptosporidium muris RN66]|uniref:Uncharacterized protein n=1 Tax=Cryptosporidium muris (strain RN66) TaxID=441375 RepID=B6ABB6_CRYMR|nr:uncharacterized protein CMU_026760 [Cryptosporidium muris RN66]EEA05668.1 hypothetical protein, conserved [Cryptosporidium muris RN66]|eukprot:XP_002140017.1 hypothetical protein [Cryptosporidium muris RN66]